MKFVALKECPQGQVPGEIFDATEDAGNVLVLVGAARPAEPHEISSDEAADAASEKGRRRYRRRDLRAED